MKICLLTTSYPKHAGDPVGPFVEGLCRQLVEEGENVDVIVPEPSDKSNKTEVMDGVRIHRIRYWFTRKGQKLAYGAGIPENIRTSIFARLQIPFLILSFFFTSYRIARKSDIIHAHWPLAGIAAVFLKKLLRKPIVLTVYGAELYTGKYKRLVSFVLKNADFLIFISSYTKSRCFAEKDSSNTAIIPPGIDTELFSPRETGTVFLPKELCEDSRLIFSIGRLVERKGLIYLLEAMPQILAECPEAVLVFAGSGPESEPLEKKIDQLGLSKNVFLVGKIDSEQLLEYYNRCRVFVIPSIVDSQGDTEGLGMVAIEALACEKPVVGSRVGGIVDIIEDGINGFLVEEKNCSQLAGKLISILDNETMSLEFGKNGRQKVLNLFNWKTSAQSTIDVYRRMINPS
jgi:glycosyltransferase involved in cell wall biosynthesis